jgi:hypothetical protein
MLVEWHDTSMSELHPFVFVSAIQKRPLRHSERREIKTLRLFSFLMIRLEERRESNDAFYSFSETTSTFAFIYKSIKSRPGNALTEALVKRTLANSIADRLCLSRKKKSIPKLGEKEAILRSDLARTRVWSITSMFQPQ